MGQSIATDAYRATAAVDGIESQVEAALDWLRPELLKLAQAMLGGPLTPVVFFQLELQLVRLLREFGRLFLERLLNGQEGDGSLLPHDVIYEGQGYRRLGKKTRNAHVATLFGTICLWRFAYRFWEPWVKESCIFPLELQLGLIAGATPALADGIGRRMAEAGATQSRVLRQLQEEQGVSMGVKRLRKLVAAISAGMSEHRQAAQVEAVADGPANGRCQPRKSQARVGRGTRRNYPLRVSLPFLGSGHDRHGHGVRSGGEAAGDCVLGVPSRTGPGHDEPDADGLVDRGVPTMAGTAADPGLRGRLGRPGKQLLRRRAWRRCVIRGRASG